MSSTAYGLRNAKVDSLAEVYGGHGEGRSKVLKVVRVQLAAKGFHLGDAQRVWLEDGSSWTGSGDAWGSGKGYRSPYSVHARLILDATKFAAERAERLNAARKKVRRRRLIELVRENAEVLLSDEELEKTVQLYQLEERAAARSVESFAKELVRVSRY